jgi:hypothetical protein
MSNAVRVCLLIVAVAVFAPVVVEAQQGHFGHHGSCQTCLHPFQVCSCTTFRPIVETHFRKQNYVTYRDVQCTQYRQATCIETVPTTCLENVTEVVMVPKLVTKQVPRTVYQQRVNHVTVPYQVTQRIPQMGTKMVPYQTVRYVPETTHSVGPVGCAQPGHFGQYAPQAVPQYSPQYAPAGPAPNSQFQMPSGPQVPPAPPADDAPQNGIDADTSATIPLMPSISVPAYQAVPAGLVPHPEGLNLPTLQEPEFDTTSRRPPSLVRQQRLGEFKLHTSQPAASDELPRINPGMFTPAPSAASVWQTPRDRN